MLTYYQMSYFRILRFLNLLFIFPRAEDEGRTRDIQLGRLTLYQLSYFRIVRFLNLRVISKSGRRGSNSRHSAWKADALPTELLPHCTFLKSSCDFSKSGRRGSNSRHSAWKADALPTELLPRFTIFKSSFDFSKSGRRGSNSRHSAWKADALPTELLPHLQFLNLCLICECKYSHLIIFCASIFCFFSDKTVCLVIITKIFKCLSGLLKNKVG